MRERERMGEKEIKRERECQRKNKRDKEMS